MAGIEDFKSKLIGGGARPNLFRVTLAWPGASSLDQERASFLIKGAALPASIIGTIEVPFRGRKLKIAGDRTFESWTITVINDNNMAIRTAFENWMNLINAHNANISAYTGSASLGYLDTNMIVEQLDRAENALKTYSFVGIYPTNISQIELSYDTTDTIEEFTVELNYQYWTDIANNIV
jgi:hypothetical protein